MASTGPAPMSLELTGYVRVFGGSPSESRAFAYRKKTEKEFDRGDRPRQGSRKEEDGRAQFEELEAERGSEAGAGVGKTFEERVAKSARGL